VLSIVPLYLQLIIVQPLQSSRRTNSLAQWIHSSPEIETLITQPFPSLSTIVATPSTSNHHPKKTSNPPEAKEPRQHSISGSKCPAKAQAQTALGCCYPEMFCNANVAACLLHRRTKRFMARERKAVPSAADEKGTQKRRPCMAVDRISSAFRDRVLLIFGQGARVGGVGT
jgi:hypothetical protein